MFVFYSAESKMEYIFQIKSCTRGTNGAQMVQLGWTHLISCMVLNKYTNFNGIIQIHLSILFLGEYEKSLVRQFTSQVQ